MQRVFAGVDVGGTRIKVGLADHTGRLLSYSVLEAKNCNDADSFLDHVVNPLKELAESLQGTIVAAGMGCPGRIDFTSGRVLWLRSKLEFLEGISLADRLQERLGCPTVCDNDVNAILTGEMRFGAGQGRKNVIAITIGTGIGGAMAMNGTLVRGRNWATGHFGYMSHDPNGPRHISGNSGIVEENASQSGILRALHRARESGETSPLIDAAIENENPGFAELFKAADSGDALGRRLTNGMEVELGVLIANLLYALDPELVLVGGGIVNHRPGLLHSIACEARKRIDYLPQDATEILPMALGDASGVLGGVALAMDALNETEPG